MSARYSMEPSTAATGFSTKDLASVQRELQSIGAIQVKAVGGRRQHRIVAGRKHRQDNSSLRNMDTEAQPQLIPGRVMRYGRGKWRRGKGVDDGIGTRIDD